MKLEGARLENVDMKCLKPPNSAVSALVGGEVCLSVGIGYAHLLHSHLNMQFNGTSFFFCLFCFGVTPGIAQITPGS